MRPPRRLNAPSHGRSDDPPACEVEIAQTLVPAGFDWAAWRRHLAERNAPAPIATLFGGPSSQKSPPLVWGLAPAAPRELLVRLAKAEKKSASRRLLNDLWPQAPRAPAIGARSMCEALSLVAWSRAAASLAEVAESADWQRFVQRLMKISRDAAEDERAALWPRQLLGGELALTLAYLFPEMEAAAQLAEQGWATLEQSLGRRVTEQGMLADLDAADWLPLFASWIRSCALGKAAGRRLSPAASGAFQSVASGLLRLTRRDGSMVFSEPAPRRGNADLDLWRAAGEFVDSATRRTMRSVLAGFADGSSSTTARPASPELAPAANCETAGMAVLRTSWWGPRLTADYAGPQLRLELDRGGEPLLSGFCNPLVSFNGKRLGQDSTWEATCWISDEDVDYLELQLSLTGDMRIQRHVMLAREDEFLFVADAVLGQRPGAIEYQMSLPLPAETSVKAAEQTREVALFVGGRRRAVALPLALNEWRGEQRLGELGADAGGLRLTQSAVNACSLFAPWFIDMAPRRLGRPCTWRRLTVAEDRQIQADDIAVGYRVQIGGRQWLFYRSLAARGNRTLLGHNLVSEFLAARFSRQGVTESLIEIEGPAEQDA